MKAQKELPDNIVKKVTLACRMAAEKPLFPPTAKLRAAVASINQLPAERLMPVLGRLLKKLHAKDERAFTAAEEKQMEEVLSLSGADVTLLLESCTYFFEQAAYYNVPAAGLSAHLSQLGVAGAPLEALSRAWESERDGLLDRLKERSVAPATLEQVSWQLHLQMAQSNMSRLKEPSAVFALAVKGDAGQRERVTMEMNHEELYAFYLRLEQLQGQLDRLT